MWGSVLGGFASFSRVTGSSDDDWIDRINHLWSVFLLGLFAIVISSGQYVGNPIECWTPAEFKGEWVSYVKSYCWIKNTYYIPMEDQIPVPVEEREDQEITYYQWVPLIFLFQALLFKFPNIVWRMLNNSSGLNMDKIVTMAENTQLGSPDDRQKTIDHIARYMDRWLKTHREYHNNLVVRIKQRLSGVCCFWFGKRSGTYLTGFYLFIKLLYCVNVVGQFFILNAFMAWDFGVYGFEIIDHMAQYGTLKESPRFPRVTLCDFLIRQMQNVQQFTVQCVLPINLFNEKIFIFLWFWLFLVAVLTFINYAIWLYKLFFKQNRTSFARKYLRIADEIHTGFDKKLSRKFAEEYLRDDGVFVLRVVAKNSTDLVLVDLVQKLFKIFKDEPMNNKGIASDQDNNEESKESMA